MSEPNNIAPLEPEKISGEHSEYFGQLFQTPPTLCGLQLKPLSISRYLLMAWRGVAFAAKEERVATAGDLLMGVLICSMTVQDFKAFAAHPKCQKEILKWGRRQGHFQPHFFELDWNWKPRLFDFFGFIAPLNWCYQKLWPELYAANDANYLIGEIQKFQDYIQSGSKAPEFWDERPDSKASAAHWSQSIEVVLRGNLNWTESEIDEKPLGQALQDYFKFMENQGLVRLMSAEEARDLATPLTKEEADEANESARKALAAIRASRGEQVEVANG